MAAIPIRRPMRARPPAKDTIATHEAIFKSAECLSEAGKMVQLERKDPDPDRFTNLFRRNLRVAPYMDSSTPDTPSNNVLIIRLRDYEPNLLPMMLEKLFESYRNSVNYSNNSIVDSTFKDLVRHKGVLVDD